MQTLILAKVARMGAILAKVTRMEVAGYFAAIRAGLEVRRSMPDRHKIGFTHRS